MSSDGQERTHKASPQKMKDVRKKGGLGKSQDLTGWLTLAAAVAMMPAVVVRAREAVTEQLFMVKDVAVDPSPARALAALSAGLGSVIGILLPMFLVVVAVAVVVNIAQGGGVHPVFRLRTESLNPGKGIKRLFSPTTLWEAVKTLAKSAAVGLAVYITLQSLVPALMGSGRLSLAAVLTMAGSSLTSMVRAGVAAGIALALVDLAVVIKRNRKQTMMTTREVQDEGKRNEGDPKVKGAIRARQRQASRNRMMAAVADADVLVVNPTHVAVALRYEPGAGAPKVVAKGSGAIATRLREIAARNRVPMVEDVPLARALYAACQLDQEVPEYLFMAVARVLAFVMALRRRGAAAGQHRTPGGTALPEYVGADHAAVARDHARSAVRRKHRPAPAPAGPAPAPQSVARPSASEAQA
ncbi:MAG: EscU/YscU/HrcU family type III secretion system export apparatus switch protein [Actinobacteria bacterium]|nr:EscU/YscU/HrcU family type III secretion system export apparatus switch protein [Actinomycetota bacterium]MCG2798907.1 EscU/YscU/HrcU family type III secretion system export apparatus switch protein [Cellulomonas sp.]